MKIYLGLLVSSLTVLAMGVALFHSRLSFSLYKPTSQSVDQYWKETGLGFGDLGSLVNSKNCSGSDRRFLACVNAISQAAAKAGAVFIPPNILRSTNEIPDQTEKEYLNAWLGHLEAKQLISFSDILTQLSSLVPEGQEPMVVGSGINGYLSVAKDPHTYILPSKYYRDVLSQPEPEMPALGVVIAKGPRGYFIRKVAVGSVAEASGLKKGDVLKEVNGRETSMLSHSQLSDSLKATDGEITKLFVSRGSEELTFEVLRKRQTISSVTHRVLHGKRKVGVVVINKFAHETCDRTEKAILHLKKQKIEGLLVDLRDNSGGLMDEAACVVSLFVGPGKQAYSVKFLDSQSEDEIAYTQENRIWAGALAVLINSGSASASEIVAGSLRELRKTPLVGERTYGKGSFQEGDVWSQNRKVALFQTRGLYFLPSGTTPQLVGLIPDVKVQLTSAISRREDDQFVYPIHPPDLKATRKFAARSVNCPVLESVSEDPELNSASATLFCSSSLIGAAQ